MHETIVLPNSKQQQQTRAATTTQSPPKILWSCVSRDDTILAEATASGGVVLHQQQQHQKDDNSTSNNRNSSNNEEGRSLLECVSQTARELLAKRATPGFEYHTGTRSYCSTLCITPTIRTSIAGDSGSESGSGAHRFFSKRSEQQQQLQYRRLKGIKFHVLEHVSASSDDDENDADTTPPAAKLRVWVFAAVYDPLHVKTVKEVQAFLEKMVTITEQFREHDPSWSRVGTLGLQATFAPILQQRMEEVTYLGKMALLDQSVQACQCQMEQNIDLILERGETLQVMQENATQMQDMAAVFKKRAKKVRRFKMMQDAKHGALLGAAIAGAVSVIIIPPLVAIL